MKSLDSGVCSPRALAAARLWVAFALVCALAVLAGPAASARAEGGQLVATATPVATGQEMSGDSANGGGTGITRSWWALSVNAGDQVTITGYSASGKTQKMFVHRVATTDDNFATSVFVSGMVPEYNRKILSFIAPQPGVMPLEIVGHRSSMGPYFFTVTVSPPYPHASNPRAFLRDDGRLVTQWQLDRDCVSQVSQAWLNGYALGSFTRPDPCTASTVNPDGSRGYIGVRWHSLDGPLLRRFLRQRQARQRARVKLTVSTTDAFGQVSRQTWNFVVPVGGTRWTAAS